MAHALPAPPVPVAIATATSFSALFNDASKDPFVVNGTYDDYLSSFNITHGAVPPDTPDAVRQRIAAAANQHLPIALLLLVDGILRPYFLPFRRDQAMGAPAHAATDNKFFAYDGELIQGQRSLVEFPNQWFNLAPQTTVATVANIGGLLAADATLTAIGPFAAGDPDTIDIRTRYTVAIPNKYAGLFLSQPDGVTPRYYFETIHPVIAADGMEATCMPLTHFCQVALTRAAAGGTSPVEVVTPNSPSRHVPLLSQAASLLHHHLPALSTGGGGINLTPLVNTIVAGQQQRAAEHAIAQADKLRKDSTTVESWLGPENFQRLLKYCGAAVEADLPPLWAALAKATAKDRLGIFQGKVANELIAMGATYENYSPNLFLLTELTALRWSMINPDALDTGSLGNAFLFTDSDIEAEQGISRQIGFVQSGGAAPSLADAQILLKMKINIPGPDDSIRAVRRLQAVYRAVLPVGHPLTNFLATHHDIMKNFDPNWQNYSTYVPRLQPLKGVFHLQWLSLKLTRYFTQLDHNYPVLTFPDPAEIVNHIQDRKQWEPIITDVFLNKYNLASLVALHQRPGDAMSVVTASTAGLGTPAGSVVSGLTVATPAGRQSTGGGGTAARSANTSLDRAENTHFNTTLFGTYRHSSIKTRNIRRRIADGELPALPASKNDSSKPVCLAWHTKGQCNTNCPLVSDHVAYSAEEYAALAAWCREHGYRSE